MTRRKSSEEDEPLSSLRERAELMVRTLPNDVAAMPAEEARRLLHELQAHEVALEMQNEEIRGAQVELAKARDRYEFAPVGYITLAEDGRILEANLTAASMLGTDRRELLKAPITRFLTDESHDEFYLHRLAALSGEQKEASEVEIHGPEGTPIAVRLESVAFGAHGERFCRTALIDISVAKCAEESLRQLNGELEARTLELQSSMGRLKESERMHVTLINNLPGAAYRCSNDKDRTMHYLSEGILRVTGHPASEFIEGSRIFGDLPHPDDAERVWDEFQTAISSRQPYQLVYRIVCGDSTTRTLWEQGEGVFSPKGELLAVEGYVADVTDLKRAEENLRSLNEFNENLIATARHIIVVIDPDGRVVRFNPAFEILSGWSPDEVEGRDWFETFLPKAGRRSIRKLFKKSIKGETTPGNVHPILTKGGEEREIEWHDAPLTDAHGRLVALLRTGTDVTHRLQLEQEVINAVEEQQRMIAQDLHDDLGSLLTGIDFRMKALTTQMVKRGEEKMAENNQEIQQLLQGAIKLTRSISKGLHAVGEHPEDLMAALRALVQRVRDNSNMRCQLRCPQPVLIHDPITANHLFRIAQEAANNAIKHSQGTQLTISLAESSEQITLRVTDNGTGFDRLEHGSSGLGLHTINYRASAIRGSAIISRRKDGGTKVDFKLPRRSLKERHRVARSGDAD